MNEKLKPCPFCGSMQLEIKDDNKQFFIVWCTCCGCEKSSDFEDDTRAGVIKEWNKRKYPTCITCEYLNKENNYCNAIDQFNEIEFGCLNHCS